ncbi:MAG: DUF2851 family protein [Bacteroidia bacterium]
MTESFLHFIWKHRLFNTHNLTTDDGQRVEILAPGIHNQGSGPDFFNARLLIGETQWAGNVEIHIQSSDWNRHNHHFDQSYDTCILHVVLENDGVTRRTDGSRMPTIELKNRYPDYLWKNFIQLIGTQQWVACQDKIAEAGEELWNSTLDKMLIERLQQKSAFILVSLQGLNFDWEECFYQYLAHNFGFQVNSMPFELVARSLPLKLIHQFRSNRHALESLLYGQSGLLSCEFKEEFPLSLQSSYLKFQSEYKLIPVNPSAWKLMRMRPVNFPTIRLSQFAAILENNADLFQNICESKNLKQTRELFNVTAGEYWNNHYLFEKNTRYSVKRLGAGSIDNLLINTVAPFLFTRALYERSDELRDFAIGMLNNISPEDNLIIRNWKSCGIKAGSAGRTQALIQLKQLHCAEKKCLSCSIGTRLINSLS